MLACPWLLAGWELRYGGVGSDNWETPGPLWGLRPGDRRLARGPLGDLPVPRGARWLRPAVCLRPPSHCGHSGCGQHVHEPSGTLVGVPSGTSRRHTSPAHMAPRARVPLRVLLRPVLWLGGPHGARLCGRCGSNACGLLRSSTCPRTRGVRCVVEGHPWRHSLALAHHSAHRCSRLGRVLSMGCGGDLVGAAVGPEPGHRVAGPG